MENKANYALVGVLATVVLAALGAFVFWFAGPSSSLPVKPYDVVFIGTVSGIGPGTDVLFNGIKIGQVKTVALDPADTDRVIARIELDASVPVKTDTKVLMGFQGLTGVGSLQLSGGSKTASTPPIEQGRSVPTLYAKVSDFQSILDGLSSTINGTSTAVDRLNGFLDTNETKLNDTITNVATFSDALAANSDGVKDALATVADVGKQIGPMAEQITALTANLDGLVAAVQPEKITKVVDNVTTFSDSLAANSGTIDEFFASASALSKNLTAMSDSLGTSVDKINAVTAEIDPKAISRVIANVDDFSAQLGPITADLKGVLAAAPPEKVASILTDVGTFTASLARNSGQIDTVLASAGTLSTSLTDMVTGFGPSVTKVNEVAAQIDPVAVGRVLTNVDTFTAQLAPISADLKGVLAAAPPEKVASILADVGTFTESLARNSAQIDTVLASAGTVSKSLTDMVAGLGSSVTKVNEVAAQIDPVAVGRVLTNVDTFTAKLGANSADIDTIVNNATDVSNSLVGSAGKVDEILNKLDQSVTNADGQGVFGQIGDAAASIKALADQLNTNTAKIAVGLNDFANHGLSSYSQLAVNAQATLDRLDRVVRNLENNPQGLIFGGDTVRDYNKK